MARANNKWLGILWCKDLVLPAPLDTTVWVKRVKVFQKGYLSVGARCGACESKVCKAIDMVLAKERSSDANW